MSGDRYWEMIQAALAIAPDGIFDGAHHKMWVIDQMVRALTGDDYEQWVSDFEQDGQFEWDVGIAP